MTWYAIATGIGETRYLHAGGKWGEADEPDLVLFSSRQRAADEIKRPPASIGAQQPMVVRYPPEDQP
jgi:hypothetical protein